MRTFSVRFVGGPLDGRSRDIAIPPVKFELYEAGNDDQVIDPEAWPTKECAGYYEQDSISDFRGFGPQFAVYVWIPCEHIPGCLKPLDSIEFAAKYDSNEERRFAVAELDTNGKIQWGWFYPND